MPVLTEAAAEVIKSVMSNPQVPEGAGLREGFSACLRLHLTGASGRGTPGMMAGRLLLCHTDAEAGLPVLRHAPRLRALPGGLAQQPDFPGQRSTRAFGESA